MVPGSTLIYGSSLSIVTLRPRDSRMAASEAAAMPFPREERPPPVMKIYLVMRVPGQMFFVGRDDTVKRPALKIQIGRKITFLRPARGSRTGFIRARKSWLGMFRVARKKLLQGQAGALFKLPGAGRDPLFQWIVIPSGGQCTAIQHEQAQQLGGANMVRITHQQPTLSLCLAHHVGACQLFKNFFQHVITEVQRSG